MKRLSWLFSILLLASPVFAQDGGGGDFGGGGDVFGGDGGLFGGGGNAGGGNRGQAQAPDRLATMKDMMLKANTPITKDQEKALNTLLDREIKAMSEAFTAKFGQEPGAAVAAPRGQQGQGQFQGRGQGAGQGRGQAPGGAGAGGPQRGAGRGGAAGAGAAPPIADNPMVAEIRRMNEELLGKVTASLKPEQQAVIRKFQNDQIRARGGIDALKLTMEEAGAPLTPDQIPQIQALYVEENQARIQLLRESQGQPDSAALSQLQLGTMTKVTRLLTPDQRKALLASMAKPR